MPTCIQWRTKRTPVAASDWAASHSWWGKIRSDPPPCRSIVSPSSRWASAEHSMCQPGRPGPHSDSHDGSSAAEGCQRMKSSGSCLLGSSGFPPRSAASSNMTSRSRWLTWPKRSKDATEKYTAPPAW
jgi:hypothetical protein